MTPEITAALIAVAGSLIGSLIGAYASSKLTVYRIDQLEKKMDEHNGVIKRTYVLEEKMQVANHRIRDIEEALK